MRRHLSRSLQLTVEALEERLVPDASPVANGVYEFVSVNSGKVLDDTGYSTSNGTQMQQWADLHGTNQQWAVTGLGNGYYKIINTLSGKSLDGAQAVNTSVGAPVIQWDYWGGDTQLWSFRAESNGSYEIVNKKSGLVADVEGISKADGALVHQWTDWQGSNQEWRLVSVAQAPTVAQAARAGSNPVTGTSVGLSVLGADAGGEANLRYTWTASGPAAVSFSNNGNNSAKNDTATFAAAGTYTFTAIITNAAGLTAASSVSVAVSQTLTHLSVNPPAAIVVNGQTVQFRATATNQFGAGMAASVGWAIAGGVGSISGNGNYSAPASGMGTAIVRATSGNLSATANVIVQSAGAGLLPSQVLVIYNADWTGDSDGNGVQDSLEVAQYYAQVHGVPQANLLGIPVANTYANMSYSDFYNDIAAPVETKLNQLGPNTINVLLFCYGIPYMVNSISMDETMMAPYLLNPSYNIYNTSYPYTPNPYFDPAPGFDPSPGHFNHANFHFYNGSPLYLTSRLDGPRGLADALEQIDQARYAQKYLYPGAGYYNGTVYVDSEGRTGSYTDASLQSMPSVQSGDYGSYDSTDQNIAEGEHYFLNSGLPLKWEDTGANIGSADAVFTDGTSAAYAPRALLFGGWYGMNNAYQWLPGSVGDNLISSSMTNGLEGYGGPIETTTQLGEGLTAATGVVNEPFTIGHPRPNVLLYYIEHGYSFAEAAALSTPYIGWMGINVGDPLYAPFAPKTPVVDTTTPTPAAGFNPSAGWWDNSGGYHLNLTIDNSNGPEVASASLQYGPTTSYGKTANSTPFYERPALTLVGLTPGKTYHMQLKLINPVGTTWTSADYTFTVPADPHDVSHPRVLTSIAVSPGAATVAPGSGRQFSAVALDQYGAPLAVQPSSFTWSVGTGTITASGLYTAPAGASGSTTVQASASGVTGHVVVGFQAPTASFVKSDATTQGNWIGTYGAAGYLLANGESDLPVWASASVLGARTEGYYPSSGRALQDPANSANRDQQTWTAARAITIDLNFSDGQAHNLSLYFLDPDYYADRAVSIQVIDPVTGQVLNSQTLSAFNGGVWLTWRLTGHVQIRITGLSNLQSNDNAMLAGLFLS